MRQYATLTKHMASDYKKDVINSYITETYCSGPQNQQYITSKHKALIEQALYGSQEWHILQELLEKKK